ncbi:MAG: large repetitive protein, partial [Solirubrobacterales bacterium]|nr:large repetitive protein [Solirubrobacterales bacterium]
MPLHLRFPARSTSLLIVAGLLAILAAGTAIALQGGGGDRAIDPDGTTCFGRTPTIVGTDANDGLLKGTDGPDVIIAARGADDVDAGGGNDLICLRGEGDRTDAGDGNDRVRGGGGEDTIFGGNGNDDLRGGRDDDQIFGDAGNDNIDGRHGDDGCTGGAGHDDIANCEGHAVGERNRAPVAVNDSDSSDENSPKTISVLANDTDPDSDPLHVASVATTGTHGTVAINGDGTLAYDPNHQFESLGAAQSAHDTFTYKATDGALESDPATVDVTVNGVNDAPVVSGLESGQLNHLTGSPASTLTSALDLADVDDSNLEGATVSIGAGLDSAHDALTFTDQLGITGTYNSGTGVLTLTGSAPVADYRTALRSVGFRSTVGGTGGNRSIAFRVSDGTDQSNSQARSLYVDNPPTNIALSPASVAENQPSGTTVGNLTSTDPEPDTQTYSLVSGAGSTDNGSFSISGAALKTGASFDFEIKSSYSVRVRSDDGHGGSFEKQLTINVTDANDAPTNVALSNASVNENQAPGAAVGNFSTTDQDLPAQSFTYTLVAGTGSTDNGSFQIAGNQLQSNAMFDKETKGTYDIRVRTTDNGSPNQNFEKQFTITIGDVNDAPTNLALSPSSIPENQPTNTTVGTLSTTDQDLPGDTFNYTEVTGTGDNDNADFTIVGNQVRTVPQFDFETKSSYTIRVQTDDNHGGTFAKAVPISITNANEQPTDIQLSSNSIPENSGAGATIGNLSTTDVDAGDTFTYTKVSGVGATDNGSFTISGNQLKAGPDFNFEVKNSYSVRLRSTDSGNAFTEKQFTISVTDVNDTPSDIALSNNSVAENTAQGTNVGNLSSTDEDLPPQTFTYTLVSGAGSTDNNDFQITGGALEVKNPLNFEAGATRSVRI